MFSQYRVVGWAEEGEGRRHGARAHSRDVAHVVVDGGINGERLRTLRLERLAELGDDGALDPAAIAENYWHLHCQQRTAWTQEIDLRPYKEAF